MTAHGPSLPGLERGGHPRTTSTPTHSSVLVAIRASGGKNHGSTQVKGSHDAHGRPSGAGLRRPAERPRRRRGPTGLNRLSRGLRRGAQRSAAAASIAEETAKNGPVVGNSKLAFFFEAKKAGEETVTLTIDGASYEYRFKVTKKSK